VLRDQAGLSECRWRRHRWCAKTKNFNEKMAAVPFFLCLHGLLLPSHLEQLMAKVCGRLCFFFLQQSTFCSCLLHAPAVAAAHPGVDAVLQLCSAAIVAHCNMFVSMGGCATQAKFGTLLGDSDAVEVVGRMAAERLAAQGHVVVGTAVAEELQALVF